MGMDDLLAEAEPDTGALELLTPMQALEDLEDALVVRGVDADAIVADADAPAPAFGHRVDADHRLLVAMELERVADQVLHQLDALEVVRPHPRQRPDLDARAVL